MGGNLSALWNMISGQGQESISAGARNGTSSGSPFKEFIKSKCLKIEKSSSRLAKMETPEKQLALQDWILASPGLKPDYLLMSCDDLCARKQSKKKVHPCSSRLCRTLTSEATNSLCLDRLINRPFEGEVEGEVMSNCSLIDRDLSVKSQKAVSFKLRHTVIFYSPDKPYCKETSLEEQRPYSSGEDPFSSAKEAGNTFDSVEEPFLKLAVDILPKL